MNELWAQCLITPLVAFEIACVGLLFIGVVDFLDGFVYWLANRPASEPGKLRAKVLRLAPVGGLLLLAYLIGRLG